MSEEKVNGKHGVRKKWKEGRNRDRKAMKSQVDYGVDSSGVERSKTTRGKRRLPIS